MGLQYAKLSPNHYVIDPNVTNDHSDETVKGSFAWVIANAGNGIHIQLLEGDYYFQGRVRLYEKSNISITGAGKFNSTFRMNRAASTAAMLVISSSQDINISNIWMMKDNDNTSGNKLLYIDGNSDRITVYRNFFYNNDDGSVTVYSPGASNIKIVDNIFWAADSNPGSYPYTYSYGVHIFQANGTIINRNKFVNAGLAGYLYIQDADNTICNSNYFYSDDSQEKYYNTLYPYEPYFYRIKIYQADGLTFCHNSMWQGRAVPTDYWFSHVDQTTHMTWTGNNFRGYAAVSAYAGNGTKWENCTRATFNSNIYNNSTYPVRVVSYEGNSQMSGTTLLAPNRYQTGSWGPTASLLPHNYVGV